MPKVVSLIRITEAQSKAAFTNHVQSIAFNLTLSRAMISGLELVRDYWKDAKPMPTIGDPKGRSPRITSLTHAYNILHSLQRRGLVVHVPGGGGENWHRHQAWKLTRPGEMVCDLLVEAGLISAQTKRRKSCA